MLSGGLLSTIPTGVPSNRNVSQLLSSFSKTGKDYVVVCQDDSSMTVYDMTRHHFVASTQGYGSTVDVIFAAPHGGVNPSAYACAYNDNNIGVWSSFFPVIFRVFPCLVLWTILRFLILELSILTILLRQPVLTVAAFLLLVLVIISFFFIRLERSHLLRQKNRPMKRVVGICLRL